MAVAISRSGFAQGSAGGLGRKVAAYLESLSREDGGYGWEGQERSHLTPTFYVIGCYRALGRLPPEPKRLAEFARTNHPAVLKKLEQERRIFEWQQAQALAWLGEEAGELRARILGWKEPLAYLKQYERHGYPLFSSEMGVILSRQLLAAKTDDLPKEFVDYLESRRRANGSFNNTPAKDGSDGHVLSTWWGLQALQVLGRAGELREDLVGWLRACQRASGGFTYAPKGEFGGIEDVAYTWAAVRGLKLLKAAPVREENCVEWIQSLLNGDGGFADRPGWLSNPMATYYALDALKTLGALEKVGRARARRESAGAELFDDFRVFSIQLEAHGRGSPAEAVDLADSLGIHLWGAKNAKEKWIERAQALAQERGAAVEFFVSNEEYGTWVDVPGLGTYSHTSDVIAPAGVEIGGSLAGPNAVSWREFRERRLRPLEQGKGRLIWQFGENEELVRMFLDDSVERGGYAAISTYHFGNPDFTNSEPFLHRWRGRIPFVALQDAHGPEPWWFADMSAGFRTLFIAREPTWEGWLEALKRNWVVPVRRDQWTGGKTWMHSGSRSALEFVRAREGEWRWWDNEKIRRPMISLVAVRAEDEFEVARPETGIALRARMAWRNTAQGLLKEPMAEFVKLIIDGREQPAQLVARQRPNGLYDDHYHVVNLQSLANGKHVATVIAREIESGKEIERRVEFGA